MSPLGPYCRLLCFLSVAPITSRTLKRSSRVMPGLRGIPAGMRTRSHPVRHLIRGWVGWLDHSDLHRNKAWCRMALSENVERTTKIPWCVIIFIHSFAIFPAPNWDLWATRLLEVLHWFRIDVQHVALHLTLPGNWFGKNLRKNTRCCGHNFLWVLITWGTSRWAYWKMFPKQGVHTDRFLR